MIKQNEKWLIEIASTHHDRDGCIMQRDYDMLYKQLRLNSKHIEEYDCSSLFKTCKRYNILFDDNSELNMIVEKNTVSNCYSCWDEIVYYKVRTWIENGV